MSNIIYPIIALVAGIISIIIPFIILTSKSKKEN